MKKLKLDLQMFEDPPAGHSITVVYDGNITSAVVKNPSTGDVLTTDVPANTSCKLTITYKSGYKLREIISMGAEISLGDLNDFRMPDGDVVLAIRSMKTGYTLTVLKDDGIRSMTKTYEEGLSSGGKVTVTRSAKTGYALDDAEVISGGATVKQISSSSVDITIGAADAVVVMKTKPANAYIVTENVTLSVNNVKLNMKKSTKVIKSSSGAVYDVVMADGSPAVLNESVFKAAIDGLVAAGVLVKV